MKCKLWHHPQIVSNLLKKCGRKPCSKQPLTSNQLSLKYLIFCSTEIKNISKNHASPRESTEIKIASEKMNISIWMHTFLPKPSAFINTDNCNLVCILALCFALYIFYTNVCSYLFYLLLLYVLFRATM